MTREKAYTELTNYSFSELIMKELFEKIYSYDKGNMKNPQAFSDFLIEESYLNNELISEELSKTIFTSLGRKDFSITSLDDLKSFSSHYQNDSYALSENKHISIIKHSRYGFGNFHDHDFFEIAYLFSGKCSHEFIIDNRHSVISLQAGELVIIPPGVFHKIEIFDDSLMVNILINRDTFQSTFLTQIPDNNTLYRFFSKALFAKESQNYMLFHSQNSKRLEELIIDMYCETTDTDSYSSRLAVHQLNMFFLYLLRDSANSIEMSENTAESEKLAAAMLLYLENNFQNASLSDVADRFNFSKTYLNRIFKNSTGSTIQQYIKKQRINESQSLLLDPALSIAEIGEMVGYNDTSYFIEEFKKKCGMTPSQYRKSHQHQTAH